MGYFNASPLRWVEIQTTEETADPWGNVAIERESSGREVTGNAAAGTVGEIDENFFHSFTF